MKLRIPASPNRTTLAIITGVVVLLGVTIALLARSNKPAAPKQTATASAGGDGPRSGVGAGSYVSVPEWGIRFKAEAADALYYVPETDSPDTIMVSSRVFDNLQNTNGVRCAKIPDSGEDDGTPDPRAFIAIKRVADTSLESQYGPIGADSASTVGNAKYIVTVARTDPPSCALLNSGTVGPARYDQSIISKNNALTQQLLAEARSIEAIPAAKK